MTLLGTASDFQRTLECPASNLLPHAKKRKRVIEAGEFGKKVHEEIDAAPEPFHAAAYAPHERRELAFVYDVEEGTARVVGHHIERAYGELKPSEVAGTVDVLIAGFYCVEVWDVKTGRFVHGNPATSYQLLFGALAARATLAPHAEVFVLGFQRTRSRGAVPENPWAVVGPAEVDDFEWKLRFAMRQAWIARGWLDNGETPRVFPGDHCRFCPAKAKCPNPG